jgi:arabinose-5-phosphate isomerase
LAPTASTTASLAMGDALAVTLMKVRNFKQENFAKFHPGGSLGRRLLLLVDDEMITDNLPFIPATAGILDLIEVMSRSSLGICIVTGNDNDNGIVTDGDIRRAIGTHADSIFSIPASSIMTLNPLSVEIGTRMEDALNLMDSHKITSLLVSENNSIVGVLKK